MAKPSSFKITSESCAYKRFLKIWTREVEFPDGRVISWDVAGHSLQSPNFVVVVPYCTRSKTFTLIQEYAQGPNSLFFNFASGSFDSKHTCLLDCARSELSEEMRLRGGSWVNLLTRLPSGEDGNMEHKDDDETGRNAVMEIKWSTNSFVPFLVLDPRPDTDPKPQDDEEHIEVIERVTNEKLTELILKGKLMLPAVQAAYMAQHYLKEHGLL